MIDNERVKRRFNGCGTARITSSSRGKLISILLPDKTLVSTRNDDALDSLLFEVALDVSIMVYLLLVRDRDPSSVDNSCNRAFT